MATQPKILLVDDDEQLLDMYQELLKQLPSQPDVRVCNSGAKALSMLDAEPFTLLITDLRMPKMDGLQVLSIVRKKFPNLRIIVLTGVMEEEYRNRAYSQGVELFCQKPGSAEEFQHFQLSVESLLGPDRRNEGGFRGMQSKSLVDLIQLECMSQSSSVLHVSQGAVEGKIWVQNGDIIDAAAGNFTGEDAFREILSWKSGSFEILPADPGRARTIHNSYQGLLLDSAQALDESRGQQAEAEEARNQGNGAAGANVLLPLTRFEGVEFVLTAPEGGKTMMDSWGLDNPKELSEWARSTYQRLTQLGEKIDAGPLTSLTGTGLHRHWALAKDNQKGLLCVAFRRTLPLEKVDPTMKHIFAKWVS